MRASGEARAGSTGRRNTFSLTGLQALVQSFGGSSPSEGLAGPCIERVSNNCEYVRTVCAQIGSFREVLSKQSIGVLVRSALPRAVRFAEVDGKAGCDPQIRMPGHLCSLVPGQRAAKLRWQCRDRPGDGIANRFSPMTGKRRPVLHARDGAVAFHSGKMQQHCEPRGAFHQSADRRSAQADDQVTFPGVPGTARSAASADRSLIMISGVTKDLPRRRLRARGTRSALPVRRQAVSSRRSAPRPCT